MRCPSLVVIAAGLPLLLVLGCSKKAPAKDAMQVLSANRDTMFALKSFQAECFTTLTFDPREGEASPKRHEFATLIAEKPMKMRYDSWKELKEPLKPDGQKPTSPPEYTFAGWGSTHYRQFGRSYRKVTVTNSNELDTILEPWDGFYSIESSLYAWATQGSEDETVDRPVFRGEVSVDGVLCDKVFVHRKAMFANAEQDYSETYYIGQKDHLVHRAVRRVLFDGKNGFTSDAIVRRIRVNERIDPKVFQYSPPAGVALRKEEKVETPPLLPEGKAAPAFVALDDSNKPVALGDFKGKVVLIDFWASWCGPCVMSMPHTQEVVKKLQDEGLPIAALAVDDGEDRNAFLGWVGNNKAKYPYLTFVHIDPAKDVSGKLYQVSGIPTQYILNAQGVIKASFVGFGGPTDDLEKALRAAAKGR